jgi:hypothetical protein
MPGLRRPTREIEVSGDGDPDVIVGEVATNWSAGVEKHGKPPISMQFEEMITHNAERGYVLRDWRLVTTSGSKNIIETIVAVFVRRTSIETGDDPTALAGGRRAIRPLGNGAVE